MSKSRPNGMVAWGGCQSVANQPRFGIFKYSVKEGEDGDLTGTTFGEEMRFRDSQLRGGP